MRHNNNRFIASIITLLMTFALPLHAENVQDFGDYVVHYNALNTDMLPPTVAKEYGISRSKNRAMLNVVVLKKVLGTSGQPTAGTVTGTSTTLTGKVMPLEFREINEPNAIYYIAEFAITNEERLTFDITVTPKGSDNPIDVRFRQQFFTD